MVIFYKKWKKIQGNSINKKNGIEQYKNKKIIHPPPDAHTMVYNKMV